MTVADREQHFEQQYKLGRELESKYAGKWVAVRGHRILDSDETETRLLDKLAQETEPFRWFRVEDATFL